MKSIQTDLFNEFKQIQREFNALEWICNCAGSSEKKLKGFKEMFWAANLTTISHCQLEMPVSIENIHPPVPIVKYAPSWVAQSLISLMIKKRRRLVQEQSSIVMQFPCKSRTAVAAFRLQLLEVYFCMYTSIQYTVLLMHTLPGSMCCDFFRIKLVTNTYIRVWKESISKHPLKYNFLLAMWFGSPLSSVHRLNRSWKRQFWLAKNGT